MGVCAAPIPGGVTSGLPWWPAAKGCEWTNKQVYRVFKAFLGLLQKKARARGGALSGGAAASSRRRRPRTVPGVELERQPDSAHPRAGLVVRGYGAD